MSQVDRRSFLKAGGLAAGTTIFGNTALQALSMRMAEAHPGHHRRRHDRGYGPVSAKTSLNDGQQWLALPDGFEYTIISKTGSMMSDGNRAPRSHDGMGAFGCAASGVRLIRNHEIRFNARAPFHQGTFTIEPGDNAYDKEARGGNTTLTFDAHQFRSPNGGLTQAFVSQTGTVVNCAGGLAFRRSGWLTCEEIVQEERGDAPIGTVQRTEQKHGYVYLTPLNSPTPGNPAGAEPYVAMGRFAHEAATVDHRRGIVYETEDAGAGRGSGFYRFLPKDPDDLARGGVLQILGIKGRPGTDLREGSSRAGRCPSGGSPSTSPTRPAVHPTRSSRRASRRARPSSTGSRAAGPDGTASSSRPRTPATPRTATSTPTGSRRGTGRSGSTGPRAGTAESSSSSTSRPMATCSTHPTTSSSAPAEAW